MPISVASARCSVFARMQDRLELSLAQKARVVQVMQDFQQQKLQLYAQQQQLHQALSEVGLLRCSLP